MANKQTDKNNFFLSSLLPKLLGWGTLFSVLFLLRSFLLLIFLVFTFSYIQSNAVVKLEKFIKNRTIRVSLVGLSFFTIFILMVAVLVPQIRDQAINFFNNSSRYAQSLDNELLNLTQKYPALEHLLSPTGISETDTENPDDATWQFRNSHLSGALKAIFGFKDDGLNKESVATVIQTVRDFGTKLIAVSSQFLLSLLFSFLIVFDLPNLKKGARSFQKTRLRFIYDEMADSLVSFGLTLGRAFEAQFLVATANTILTAAGIWIINIRDEMAFLSLIVFLCGFVPIAGVFISSIPICLLALADGGISKLLLAIFLISFVHAIESYILNPRIFGSHMKLNPVMVMILMTVSGKLFGVWGLVLCLPITTYICQYAIQYDDDLDEETKDSREKNQNLEKEEPEREALIETP